jgi:hypothetical protein
MNRPDHEVEIMASEKVFHLRGNSGVEIDFCSGQDSQVASEAITRRFEISHICGVIEESVAHVGRFVFNVIGKRNFGNPGPNGRLARIIDRRVAVCRLRGVYVIIEHQVQVPFA